MEKQTSLSLLDRSMDVIEFLDSAIGTVSVSEISEGIGVNKSTVFRILNTLVLRGYVYQNPETKKYGLSLAFFHIGVRTKRKMSDTQRLAPYIPTLEQLSRKYGENVNVATLDFSYKKRMKVMNLYNVKAPYMLERPDRDLNSMEAYTSAAGKCLLAYSSDSYLDNFRGCRLDKVTAYSIADWPTLNEELLKIRNRGFSECVNEHEIGISCVAVPIFGLTDFDIKAAISLSGDSASIAEKKSPEMIADLQQIAKKIAAAF